ncbi:hypothetical protein ACLKA6_016953 [Drosophila palustris]
MKIIIALACLLAVACANEDANVLRSESDVGTDSFKYALELDNSNKQEQSGKLIDDTWTVNGEYSHDTPEGEKVHLTYVANENGYQVLEANPPLPTAHPIPDYIQRAIAYIQAHPNKDAQQ